MNRLHRSMACLAGMAFLLFLSSCSYRYNRFESFMEPPCKRFQTGTVCFHNFTKKDVKVNIGDAKTEVQAKTTLCMDLYAGNYEYKAKQGGHKWEEELLVLSCKERQVYLER